MRGCAAIGVDVGGTKIAVGLIVDGALTGRVLQVPTPPAGGSALLREITALITELPLPTDHEIVGVGVATGGVVDERGRIVAATDLLADWRGRAVAEELSALTGQRVAVANDGQAYALSQAVLGAADPTTACVAVGTGIGGGLLINGRLWRGERRTAGEFGHLPYATDERCSCGATGHIEGYAAGPALNRRYRAAGGSASSLALAPADDPVAAGILRDGGTALGVALAGPVWLLDADLVLLGGSVGTTAAYVAGVAAGLNRTLPSGRKVPVRAGDGGAYATVIGAAQLILSDA